MYTPFCAKYVYKNKQICYTNGVNNARTAEAARAAGLADVVHAGDYQQAADALLARMKAGDALLVKASRGMALEKALALFYPVCGK